MTTTFIHELQPFACSVPGCDVFPFDRVTDLAEHLANHAAYEATSTAQLSVLHHQAMADAGTQQRQHGTGGGTHLVDGPTERQLAFIAKLADERGVEAPTPRTKTAASKAIETLMALPRSTPAPVAPQASARPAQELAPGMYRVGEAIYKVQVSRESRNLYAKVLGGDTESGYHFDYQAGAIRLVREQGVRLTEAEAMEFGQRTGTCCVCAAVLTNPTSIELGIGPICRGKL